MGARRAIVSPSDRHRQCLRYGTTLPGDDTWRVVPRQRRCSHGRGNVSGSGQMRLRPCCGDAAPGRRLLPRLGMRRFRRRAGRWHRYGPGSCRCPWWSHRRPGSPRRSPWRSSSGCCPCRPQPCCHRPWPACLHRPACRCQCWRCCCFRRCCRHCCSRWSSSRWPSARWSCRRRPACCRHRCSQKPSAQWCSAQWSSVQCSDARRSSARWCSAPSSDARRWNAPWSSARRSCRRHRCSRWSSARRSRSRW